MKRLGCIVLCATAFLVAPAHAHKPSDSYLSLDASSGGERVSGQWDIAVRDLEHAIGVDRDGDGAVTWGELRGREQAIVGTLSQGQRRKAALARLWLDDTPRTWLLDEPLDALDTDGVGRFERWITAHTARGGALLMTSHTALPSLALAEVHLGAAMAAMA